MTRPGATESIVLRSQELSLARAVARQQEGFVIRVARGQDHFDRLFDRVTLER